MCRFVVYKGPGLRLASLITEPEHSLIHQSYKSEMRLEPLNGDGFGVAWYAHGVSPKPACFRSIQPAWNNANLRELARVTRSPMIFAHVRAATEGLEVGELNCHPFTAGHLTFMHNGRIVGFPTIKRRLQRDLSDEAFLSIRGTTDSENLFAVFQDAHARHAELDGADRLAESLRSTIESVISLGAESCTLNMAVTDGDHVAVSRFADGPKVPSLFFSRGRRFHCEDGVCHMESGTGGNGAVLVASEPLSETPGWQEVPENHLLLIRENSDVELQAVA